jgi:hypothetical protein
LALALAASVASLTVVPPAHVHDEDEDGHHELLVHRHLSAHVLLHHEFSHGVIDHADERIVTLDDVFTIPSAPVPVTAPPVATVTILDSPAVVLQVRLPRYVEPLIHGPPRAPAGLRAPPFTSYL